MGQAAYALGKAPNGLASGSPQPVLPIAPRRTGLDPHPFRLAIHEPSDGVVAIDILNGFCKLVGELGGDSTALITEVGLPSAGFGSGEKVSLRRVGRLFEMAAQRLNCPDFGLRLAEKQLGCSVMKPLERLISHAPTLERTMRCCIDHMAAYSSGIRLTLEPASRRAMHRLRFELLLDDDYQFPQLVEQLTLLGHKTAQDMTGGYARARAVSFSHTRLGSKWDYARRFSAPVSFDQGFDDIFFADSDLRSHVIEHDEDIFASEYERISVQYPAAPLDIRARVMEAIKASLTDACGGRDEVCATMGVSSRTLHRQLARLGTNFEQLRDEVRRNLCLRYLARTDMTITQVAGRIGFSEGSVLTHFCRKWFAESPRNLRRKLVR